MAEKLDIMKKIFSENLLDLGNNLLMYLEKTVEVSDDFGGPSIYFHQEAIREIDIDFLGKRHLDMIYAVLPAWGMHRMGEDTKTKVINFEDFIAQIEKIRTKIEKLRDKHISEVIFDDLFHLVTQLRVSISDAFLVSSSKVLHHILPNLICPIDRQYSIRFMSQKKGLFDKSTIDFGGYEIYYAEIFLKEMISFIIKHESLLGKYINKEFNTSITKIFDNLLIVYVKNNRKKINGKNQ